MKLLFRNLRRKHRARRVRAKVSGTAERPRVNVFCSLRGIYVQVIDDTVGRTICAASLVDLPEKERANTVKAARDLGKLTAAKCLEKKIKKAVFDRGGRKYHGKVSAVAEGLREGGITI